MRVGTDHHETGESVILKDDLVAVNQLPCSIQGKSGNNSHDTGSWLPEADTVLGTSGSQEVVDLLVDIDGTGQVLGSADLGLDQVVTVDRSGDGSLGKTSRHELEDGHLGGSVLACDTLFVSLCSCINVTPIMSPTHVRSQLQVGDTTLNVLLVRVVQVAVHDLLGESQRAVEPVRQLLAFMIDMISSCSFVFRVGALGCRSDLQTGTSLSPS